ncbi:hypothetical protein ACHAWF_014819 [Thalassiosira exigua]
MVALSVVRNRNLSASAASFVVRQCDASPSPIKWAPSLINQRQRDGDKSGSLASSPCAFSIDTEESVRNGPTDTRFDQLSRRLAIGPRRTMATALGGSREGLSDIGPPTKSDGADGGESGTPNWKERIDVSIARSRKIRGSNYVQISTVDYETMEPRCRTVVFRGFLRGVPFEAVKEVLGGEGREGGDDSKYDCAMKMITDARSNKVQELEQFHEFSKEGRKGSTAETVWWFPKSSEQYRIRGRLQFVGGNGPLYSYADNSEQTSNYLIGERKQQWGNLSDLAREQFYWENPGIPYTSDQANGVPPGGRDGDSKVLPPPDTFLLMLLYPTKIDYLRLGDNYRQPLPQQPIRHPPPPTAYPTTLSRSTWATTPEERSPGRGGYPSSIEIERFGAIEAKPER